MSIAKYPVDPDAPGAHGRFGALYESGTAGKSVLLSQCVAGGMILKECGLLDLITQIDTPAYQAGTPGERRAMLLAELRAMFGQGPAVPAVEPVSAPAPAATPEPAHVEPAPQLAPATPITPRRPQMPNLGRALDDKDDE